jgi:hypothetical protein
MLNATFWLTENSALPQRAHAGGPLRGEYHAIHQIPEKSPTIPATNTAQDHAANVDSSHSASLANRTIICPPEEARKGVRGFCGVL